MTRAWAHCALSCLTLVTGAVHAQSHVSISGCLDIGVYRDTGKRWNVGPIQRDHIAFSGSEDLGGGLSATFRLGHRVDLGTGGLEGPAKPFWHGESTVGLAGAFGSIQFGRRLDAMSANEWEFDPWGNYDRLASPAWDLWHQNFPSDPTGNDGSAEFGRLNNGIFFDSPTVHGVALHLSGTPETGTGNPRRAVGGALTFRHADFAAMAARERNGAGDTDTFLGLRGGFERVTLMGAYDISKSAASTAKATTLGVEYRLGATTLKAGWGQVDVDGVKVEKMVGLGMHHALSKRVALYADVAHKRFVPGSRNTYGVGLAYSF
jgi:predicted porin